MKTQIRKFLQEEDGITALEYGVLAAIILVAVALFAGYISGLFGTDGTITKKVKCAVEDAGNCT